MEKKTEILNPYLTLLKGLLIYEVVNYLAHFRGWSLFGLHQLEVFRGWVSFADVDRMLVTSEYAKYAGSYAEFMVFGVLTFPVLLIILMIGLFKSIPQREFSAIELWFVAVTFFALTIVMHMFVPGVFMLLGTRWPWSGGPDWIGILTISIFRMMTYLLVVGTTSKYYARIF